MEQVVFVTGARGFLGRHLSCALKNEGYSVCALGHGTWPEVEHRSWGVDHWLNGDVTKRNLDLMEKLHGSPRVIFHLAGGSSVGPSLSAPEEDFRRSVLSASELLEWARGAPGTPVVLASSAAVYGAGHSTPISETAELRPYSPYGYHKRIAEVLFESYGKNYGVPFAVIRFFSLYGPELRKQLLWDACGRLQRDPKHLPLGGSGHEIRDWLHVSDAARLLMLAAGWARSDGVIVNGGSGVPVSVRDLAAELCSAWGEHTILEFSGKSRPGDPQNLVADVTVAAKLGFISEMPWQLGLGEYVRWFKREMGLSPE